MLLLLVVVSPAGAPLEARAQDSNRSVLSVLGGLNVEGTVEQTERGKRVRGRVSDELGAACSDAEVALGLPLRSCGPHGGLDSGTTTIRTDGRGEFCADFDRELPATWNVEVSAPSHETYRGELHLRPIHDDVPRFVQAPTLVDLESPNPLVVEVWSSAEHQSSSTLLIEALRDGSVERLAERPVTQSELARFEIPTAAFGAPGRIVLRARRMAASAGAGIAPSSAPWSVDVRGQVVIEAVAGARDDEWSTATVSVRSHAHAVTSGLVEVRDAAGGRFLASSDIENGEARLQWTNRSTDAPRTVRLAYAPASPHFQAGSDVLLTLPPRHWLTLRSALQAIALVGLLAWLVWSWRKTTRAGSASVAPGGGPSGEAGIVPVRRSGGSIRGTVVDAHTGSALALVRLRLVAPTATGVSELETTTSDAEGAFRFSTDRRSASVLRLEAASATHMGLDALVASTELEVRLTERRRAGLIALFSWARSSGSPWFQKKPPTPGEVSRVLLERGSNARANWALNVELLSYGPRLPTDQEIRDLESPLSASADVDGSDPRFL